MPARINVVHRADSFRSERSDASAANKRVSFQPRVDVKHVQHQQQPVVPNVYKEPTSLNEVELAKEAERIIKQVDQISCTVSPNPTIAGRLPAYETRSLERSSKRNNRQPQHPHQEVVNSWKTLPTATKTNLLLDKQNSSKNKASKNLVLEKSTNQQAVLNNHNLSHNSSPPIETTSSAPVRKQQQQQQQLDMHHPTTTATTPPKYDSGIEMEGGGSLNRPNVNLIVQQLTEEARQRELIRRQYQEELLRLAGEAAELDQLGDPLAPRLPTLNLIEPDPQFGVAHNRNLPFSYTGGSSPTRLSPLRSSGMRFPSPPRQQPPQPVQEQPPQDITAVYAQVDRQRHESPERTNNLFDRGSADKVVPGKINFHQSDVIRQHLNTKKGEELDSDMDRAKARFLFGDDGRNNNNRFSSLPYKDTDDFGTTAAGQRYTTKIVIGDDRPAHQRIIQTSSYEDEYERKRRAYQDRSVSPEPCALPVANRVRTLERQMSDEQQQQQQKSQRLTSTRLIQEAERGRTSFRTPRNPSAMNQQPAHQYVSNSSRLVAQVNSGGRNPAVIRTAIHDSGDGTPKPPIRAKKLSRERLTGNSGGGGKVIFGGKTKTVPWRPDASPESSPERFIPSYTQPSRSSNMYRYQQRRSDTPSPERVIIKNNNNNNRASPPEPEKQEKIRRQRSKFLSVFLGSRANKNATTTTTTSKNNNNNNNSSGSSSNKPARAQAPPVSRWTDDEVDFARRPSTRQPTTTATTKTHQQYRVVHHHHSSKDPSRQRESSYTDRTDTSESDEMHRHAQQRFKSQRQKSQSYNNLNYRPDPAVVLPEEVRLTKVTASSSKQQHYDTKPYASTNIIRHAEMHRHPDDDEPLAPLPTGINNNNGRPVRYFGDTDLESQQSRNYSGTRYVPRAKVMRSSSTAAGVGAVRRGVMQRNGQPNKMPVSSVNSSESDGSAMQSGASAESQRSVYLHATTCADIPTVLPASKLRQRAKSREDMSALSGHSGSTLRQSRHISRSYSVLAPWKPRHYRDKYEISYSNQQVGGQPVGAAPVSAADVGKPPRIPRARNPSAHRVDENAIAEDYEPQPPLVIRPVVQPSSGSDGKTANFVARSASMPKGGNGGSGGSGGNRMAGWFRSKKKQQPR